MGKSKVIGFNAKKWEKDLTDYWVGQQTARFVAYAKEKVKSIGEKIMSYNSKNHMTDTGNLLDSLYWGVSYNGQMVQMGFFSSKIANRDSYLHAWLKDPEDIGELYPVNGRMFAYQHAERYGNNEQNQGKWKVWFAILAPYWGYWENGFNMKRRIHVKGGEDYGIPAYTTSFMRFAVMAEFYDVVNNELKPARVRYRHPVSKYTQKGLELRRKRDYLGRIKDYYNHGNANLR